MVFNYIFVFVDVVLHSIYVYVIYSGSGVEDCGSRDGIEIGKEAKGNLKVKGNKLALLLIIGFLPPFKGRFLAFIGFCIRFSIEMK